MNYNEVIEPVAVGLAVKAVKYLSTNQVVKATRKLYKYNNRRIDKRHDVEIVVKIGRPNYLEREFIKLCQKAHEPFPIKKVQLKLYNPKSNLKPRKKSRPQI